LLGIFIGGALSDVGAGLVALAAGGGAASFASNYVNWATVIEVLVTNPIAQNLHVMAASSLYSFDLVDDLINFLKEKDVSVSFGDEI